MTPQPPTTAPYCGAWCAGKPHPTAPPTTVLVMRIQRALSDCPRCGHAFHGSYACDVGMVECGCVDEDAGAPDDPLDLLREAAAALNTEAVGEKGGTPE